MENPIKIDDLVVHGGTTIFGNIHIVPSLVSFHSFHGLLTSTVPTAIQLPRVRVSPSSKKIGENLRIFSFIIYNSPFLHFVRKPDLDYVYNSVGKNCPDFI